ncbi:MAG: MBL fold metallo-hydrolase [Oscillospiraceae bacterium]|jgi:glyoxylase-like metal-dependent hydrolase (beta-lactamase superfamily II)|nr:MBL fold metallo-hydrolase [Oscillospiraceae bacterium]
MLIKTLPVGQLETNCYIVTDQDTRECAIIDPGAESNTILDYIESNNLKAKAIFLTHGHFDHYMALGAVMEVTGAPAYINERDVSDGIRRAPHKLDGANELEYYNEGDVLNVGGLEFTIMETPGHSPGSVTLKCETALFTGDTLFRDSCGRTDLGGDMDTLLSSLRRLSLLDGDYEVYPGHAETTTLDRERNFNYYMKYAKDENKHRGA